MNLAFNEVLDGRAGRLPPASAFTVTADGSTVTVTKVQRVFEQYVQLDVDPRITKGQTVTVSYRDPTPGDDATAIQDYAGNDAASFTDQAITSISELLGAPTNLTATGVRATRIDLAWEAPSGFTTEGYRIEVSADGGTTWTDRVADTESTDTAYSHTGLTLGDTRHYRVSAISGISPALASNVASATAFDTADTTAPGFVPGDSGTRVSELGISVNLAFNEVLDGRAGRLPPASAFTVTADGSTVTVTKVQRVFEQYVQLDVDPRITKGQTVTVSYRDPTGGDDEAAIQDYAGNDAASFTDQAITSISELLGGPTNLRATRRSLNETDLSWQAPADFVPESYRVEGQNLSNILSGPPWSPRWMIPPTPSFPITTRSPTRPFRTATGSGRSRAPSSPSCRTRRPQARTECPRSSTRSTGIPRCSATAQPSRSSSTNSWWTPPVERLYGDGGRHPGSAGPRHNRARSDPADGLRIADRGRSGREGQLPRPHARRRPGGHPG